MNTKGIFNTRTVKIFLALLVCCSCAVCVITFPRRDTNFGAVVRTGSRHQSTDECIQPELHHAFDRSYILRAPWPFPMFRMVLETVPGTCDLYGLPHFCLRYEFGLWDEPERHVTEAIASVASTCLFRPHHARCKSIDLGSSTGYFTMMMASLGSHVTAIDPQPDMLRYLKESASLNCWSDRVSVHHAMLTPDSKKHGTVGPYFNSSAEGGRPLCLNHHLIKHFEDANPLYFSYQALLDEVGPEIQVIKYDAHLPEGLTAILKITLDYIVNKGYVINSIITEGASLTELFRFQELGYSIYILMDPKLQTRFFDERGWDLFNGYRDVVDDDHVEEVFHQRAMQMMYRVKKLPWSKFRSVPINHASEILITRTQFVFPQLAHRYNTRTAELKAKKYFPIHFEGEKREQWWLKRLEDFSGPGYDEYRKAARPVATKDLEELYITY